MAQHALHSKEARNLTRIVNNTTDEEAEQLLAHARWGVDDKQGCPRCGVLRRHYRRPTRRQWRCAECDHVFSVTSGTALAHRKLDFRTILRLILCFETAAKGRALIEVSRLIGCTPKTAQAFYGKLRETFVNTMDLTPLKGLVHVDGGYFGGKPRKPNRRAKMPKDALKIRFGTQQPKDRSKPWIEAGMTHRNWLKRANKRVVMSFCESAGRGDGSRRVLAFVCRSEHDPYVPTMARRLIAPDTMVMTDESSAFNFLSEFTDPYVVAHKHEYSTPEGVNNNLAESFNSRMRRAEYGVYHGYRPKYLQDYASEFSWRETHRRDSQRTRFMDLLTLMVSSPVSQWWAGYWQGQHRSGELNFDYFLRRAGALP